MQRALAHFAFSLALVVSFRAEVVRADANERDSILRQVAGVLDYLAADYAGAVSPTGEVLSREEYDEQLELVDEAKALGLRAGLLSTDGTVAALGTIRARMDEKAAPEVVARLCRETRRALIKTHHLVLAPTSPPNYERAARLYQEAACATCHGNYGGGDGPAGRNLVPPPANFLDAERVASVSPARAFHAITYGITGTGMANFEHLRAADRWSLAYYVLAMRHTDASAGRGKLVSEQRRLALPTSAQALSDSSDETLLASMDTLKDDERAAVLAFERRIAPFDDESASAATFDVARAKLAEGLEAYRGGRTDAARRLFVSAYLDGVEPNEAALAVRDEPLLRRIETAMMAVREAAARGDEPAVIETHIREARSLLREAEDGDEGSGTSVLLGAAVIALREGFEAALLLATLLGLVRKRNKPEQAKFVHLGWVSAILVGLATWFLVGHLIGGLERELAEGIIALVAAFVLLGVTHWVMGQVSSKHFFGFLFKRTGATSKVETSAAVAALGVFGLSFVAAYREAFEVVLFYQAMLLQSAGREGQVWLGASAGIAVLLVIVAALKVAGQKLEPKKFMLASSVILAFLALVMVGKGVHALQEAAVIPMTFVARSLNVPSIGLFGTLEGLLAQGALFVLLALSAVGLGQKKAA
jgi:high-affinity iron transporter